MHTTLIEIAELVPHLGDQDWAIIDARFDLADTARGEASYLAGHVEGAVYAHLDRDLSGTKTGTNGRHPLPSVDAMAETFSRWGINEAVQVIVYDASGGPFASRLWWMLRYLGHDAVAVVDGDPTTLASILREGREEREPRKFTPAVRDGMLVRVDELAGALDERLLLDARAAERYRGENETLDPVAGRIPGARNVPWSENLGDRGHFRVQGALRESYDAVLDGRKPQDAVCYCGSGVTACHSLLAMEVAGLSGAKLYAGSWSEWCADESRPVETGEPSD